MPVKRIERMNPCPICTAGEAWQIMVVDRKSPVMHKYLRCSKCGAVGEGDDSYHGARLNWNEGRVSVPRKRPAPRRPRRHLCYNVP